MGDVIDSALMHINDLPRPSLTKLDINPVKFQHSRLLTKVKGISHVDKAVVNFNKGLVHRRSFVRLHMN